MTLPFDFKDDGITSELQHLNTPVSFSRPPHFAGLPVGNFILGHNILGHFCPILGHFLDILGHFCGNK